MVLSTLVFLSLVQSSCKKFLEIEPPYNSLVPITVFKSDDIATSSVLGVYSTMSMLGFASGDSGSIGVLAGLTADEYNGHNAALALLQSNQLTPDDAAIKNLWINCYNKIYACNSILEGLEASNTLTPSLKLRLKGEAMFLRAFTYFYLVNLFGAVPLHLTTELEVNGKAFRKPTTDIHKQIISDLKEAESLLDAGYPNTERVRANKATVQSLLARVYLYLKDWGNAEAYSSKVIIQSTLYEVLPLDQVFLKNSRETIWQLMPSANTNTNDGNLLILTGTPTMVSFRNEFVQNSFENGDQRKVRWVGSFSNASGTYYYPFKYKVKSSTILSEYSMVIRLAELYLVRAEALIQLDKYDEGLADLNRIRRRAGLDDLKNTLSKVQLIDAVMQERKVELFSEWGHRWFDLVRSGTATTRLSLIKPFWKTTSVLYPISSDEIAGNRNITQNEGY